MRDHDLGAGSLRSTSKPYNGMRIFLSKTSNADIEEILHTKAADCTAVVHCISKAVMLQFQRVYRVSCIVHTCKDSDIETICHMDEP